MCSGGINLLVKPTFHKDDDYIGKKLDEAFSEGVKEWLGEEAFVTDAWLVTLPKLGVNVPICIDVKYDDGADPLKLAYGQFKFYAHHYKDTLYIFQRAPDDLDVLYWWLDPLLRLKVSESPYFYYMLPRGVCTKSNMGLLKALLIGRYARNKDMFYSKE